MDKKFDDIFNMDEDFQALNFPSAYQEYLRLQADILANGRNVTGPARKFLIGLQYLDEGKSHSGTTTCEKAKHIAAENHVAPTTVKKYASYARILKEVGDRAPEVVKNILSGQIRISHKNLAELSRLKDDEFNTVVRRLNRPQRSSPPYSVSHRELQRAKETPTPSVKDMPVYDPDAEIVALALTIPSWSSSIERTRGRTELNVVSAEVREKLTAALTELQERVSEMLSAAEEE